MTLSEYYGLPDGLEIKLKANSFWDNIDIPYITNMSKAFYYCVNTVVKMRDTSNVTDMNQMFSNCQNLKKLNLFDTSNVTNMNQMFYYCSALNKIPLFDTSNVTNMGRMFERSGIKTLPQLNTSNVTDMGGMFNSCGNLETLPELDTSNVTNMQEMFSNYGGLQNLKSLPKFNVPKLTNISRLFYTNTVTMTNLTEVGGWENIKCNWNDNGGLACLPNLTYQSCINVLNGLYDFTGNGETPTSSQGKLKVHSNFITTVGDEISIGTSKGWLITS